MGWRKDQFLLWSSDGTNDITLGTTNQCHNVPLDKDNPPNDVADIGSLNYYNPASLDRIDVTHYEKFALYSVTRPVQGTDSVGFSANPAATVVSVPVPVGSAHEGNALLNSPWDIAPAAQHASAVYNEHRITFHAPTASLTGTRGNADGSVTGQWTYWGWRQAGLSVNPLDIASSMIFLGYPSMAAAGSPWTGAWEGLPSVMAYDELMVSLMWVPQWGGVISTPLRILGRVYGIGYYQERGQ